MSRARTCCGVMIAVLFAATISANAQRQMEGLGRGVVAVNQGEGKAFVSWRMLGTEPDSIAFNVYRTAGSGEPVKLNAAPLTQATCYQDSGVDFSQPVLYTVRAVLNGQEKPASAAFKFPANAPVRQYLSIPLQAGRGVPNDASVGDLNGDGDYEIVLKREEGSRDNSRGGVTGSTTYTLDGTFLWKIDLGKHIRGGAHYTQFMVYDLDGDGKAEVVCKTADGMIDGKGNVIGDAGKNYVSDNGMILKRPEFLTVFGGPTGVALATTDYVPSRGGDGSGWGDNRGNRVDRFLACVAYNQPPWTSFFLGFDMKAPPKPNIRLVEPKTTP
jgi:rhamnogalacturonan endolyase